LRLLTVTAVQVLIVDLIFLNYDVKKYRKITFNEFYGANKLKFLVYSNVIML